MGFGTWQLLGQQAFDCVVEAIKCGYRYIDTAQAYQNEAEVGKAINFCIQEGFVKRKDLFVCSKLNFFNPIGYKNTIQAVNESLQKMELDYLDSYLIHWPNFTPDDSWKYLNASTWKALEDLKKQGFVKHPGVSNFLIHHLEELLKTAEVKPILNQLNLNPQWQQKEIVKFCEEQNIKPVAWSANMSLQDWNRDVLETLAKKYDVSISQLCYRWGIQKGFSVLARSKNPVHIAQNLDVLNFEISKNDMTTLDELNSHPTEHNQHPDVMYGVYRNIEKIRYREYVVKTKYYFLGQRFFLRKNKADSLNAKIKLFGFIPFLRLKSKKEEKIKVYLFNFIPIGFIKRTVRQEQKHLIPEY